MKPMRKATLLTKEDSRLALEEYTKDWKLLVDTLPYPLSIVDTDFNVVAVNKAMVDLTGGENGVLNYKCFQSLHCMDSPIDDCPMVNTLKSGKNEQTEIYEPACNKYLLVSTAPIIRDADVIGVIHSILDITAQRERERGDSELIEIYASSINEMKTRELKAQKGRDAFLNMLEDISESYKELEDLFMKLVRVMVNALDAKSPWTKGHSERVSIIAEQIAHEMAADEDEIKDIKLAGLLHDIGKIGTYDYLLDKPGRLTKEEFEVVKKHPVQGATILQDIKQLRDIIPFIRYHHEKLDGKGYPDNLHGDQIPLGARILHVADSFDSMTSDRPYRPAPGVKYALSEMEKFKGIQFDHKVVDAFLRVLEKSEEWEVNLPSE